MLKSFVLAFIPLFVTVDPLGILPIFVSLTHGADKKKKRKIIIESLWTATALAVFFIFLGKIIFQILGISMGDFMIAGGAILFCISIIDLLQPGKQYRLPPQDLGVVPIGTPLIVGPAVLTTSLMIIDIHGVYITLFAVLLNILLVGYIFFHAEALMKVLGHAGSLALSKIMALLLAAIAVMMIRKGVVFFMTGTAPTFF